ncbi:MAG TPA: PDZ domain-containing protein, partial [Terriglobia bacterium]|nr:PDZ domain-containing protein [Terriglobia bacterium]
MGSNLEAKRILTTLALSLALIAAITLNPSVGTAQKAARKLTEQDIIDLLTGDVPSDQVAQEAQKAGISFQVTAAVAKQIRDAGGTDDLIRVLQTLAPQAPAAPAKPPRTVSATSSPTLLVESSPGQSQVYVDDEPVGSTSQQGHLKLPRVSAGQHRVRISLSGYQDHEETVTLAPGKVTTVTATLQRPEAPAVVSPPPSPEAPNPEPEAPPTVRTGQGGYLGVMPLTQQPAGSRGVVISAAQPGGPAAQAGLKAYDTILAVNGQPVTTTQDLRATLATHQAGEAVQITWYNGTNTVTRQIRLSAPPVRATVQPNMPPSLLPHKGLVTFTVAHDHGQSGKEYCTGMMSIGNGMIYYKGAKGTNGVHNFEIPLASVREARRNAVYLVAIGAFH